MPIISPKDSVGGLTALTRALDRLEKVILGLSLQDQKQVKPRSLQVKLHNLRCLLHDLSYGSITRSKAQK
jgi:hypothetical protein